MNWLNNIRQRDMICTVWKADIILDLKGFVGQNKLKELNDNMERDIDFEEYPDEHCIKAPELLREGGVGEDVIHGVVSHGYQFTVDVKPEHQMEKVLYAVDELTGLIGAVTLMRPSKSVMDMEVKSVKKKYKNANFAAGCSREVIENGAKMLDITLEELMEQTILAMRSCEAQVLVHDQEV